MDDKGAANLGPAASAGAVGSGGSTLDGAFGHNGMGTSSSMSSSVPASSSDNANDEQHPTLGTTQSAVVGEPMVQSEPLAKGERDASVDTPVVSAAAGAGLTSSAPSADAGSDVDAEGEDDTNASGEVDSSAPVDTSAEPGIAASVVESTVADAGAADIQTGNEGFSTPPTAESASAAAAAAAAADAVGPLEDSDAAQSTVAGESAPRAGNGQTEGGALISSVPAPIFVPVSVVDGAAGPTTKTEAALAQPAVPEKDDLAANFLKQTFDSFEKAKGIDAAMRKEPMEPREILKKRIDRDRRDGDAWLGLINDALQRADLQDARQVYEEFVGLYPNAARQWQDYASLELQHSEFQNVESIFTRCLRTTPSTDLWRFYLQYTRRVNPLPPAGKGGAGEESERERVRKVIEGAYEFALRFVGQSRDAGDVWRDYITLLKERETSNQWQAGQKMDDIRRTYQRAVSIPLANVEMIWREYDAYENSLNRITAKKFLADRSAAYMTARTAFREMRNFTDNLHRPIIPRVPCWAVAPSLSPLVTPLTIVRDRHHVEAWKKYLRWEENNPLQLEDTQTLQSRVLMAYRKAVMHLRFYPELWYMAACYLESCQRYDEAQTWLKNGMEACTGSSLLCFAYVELAERQSQAQVCGGMFTELLEWIHAEIDRLHANLEHRITVINEEAERLKAAAAARKRDEGAADYVEGEEREEMRKMDEAREVQREAERESARPKIDEMKEYASLVWIKYMHFVRRTEGQRPMRTIFARARKSKHCTWQVFEANALMEYHCSKDVAVATKVFELALKSYGEDEAFVVRYLDFLLSVNDDNNARALFERTVSSFAPDRARPLWDRWCEYEYSFGDSASIAKINERLNEVYPDDAPVKRLVDRNSYMDLDVVGPRDLGLRVAGAGGSNAAERAVTASREMANEATTGPAAPPTGPRADTGAASAQTELVGAPSNAASAGSNGMAAATGAQGGTHPAKRARFADDVASSTPTATPPTGPAASRPIPTGPRGTKRSVSPPARFVPPPREGFGVPSGPAAGTGPQQQPPPALAQPSYLEVPDGILFFMDALPNTASFDGPRLQTEDILECLSRSNVAVPDLGSKMSAQQQQRGGGGSGMMPGYATPSDMSGAGFRGRGYGRRGGFARGGRRF